MGRFEFLYNAKRNAHIKATQATIISGVVVFTTVIIAVETECLTQDRMTSFWIVSQRKVSAFCVLVPAPS